MASLPSLVKTACIYIYILICVYIYMYIYINIYIYSNLAFLQRCNRVPSIVGEDRLALRRRQRTHLRRRKQIESKVSCTPNWFEFEFPLIKTTKLWVETRLRTWAKRIYPKRLISSCRAPLVYTCTPSRLTLSRLMCCSRALAYINIYMYIYIAIYI